MKASSNLVVRPKFIMGKIVSKNLIVEVLSFVESLQEIINRLLFTNRSLRCLVIENLYLIENQGKSIEITQVSFLPNQDNIVKLLPIEVPQIYRYII
jgi:hypothetical protein